MVVAARRRATVAAMQADLIMFKRKRGASRQHTVRMSGSFDDKGVTGTAGVVAADRLTAAKTSGSKLTKLPHVKFRHTP